MIASQFGFPDSVIKIMRDSGKPGEELPSKVNIQNAIGWLVQGAKAGDHLVLHYSGHGGQVVDQNGDEADGYDGIAPLLMTLTESAAEGLIPCDYATAGYVIDDWYAEPYYSRLHSI